MWQKKGGEGIYIGFEVYRLYFCKDARKITMLRMVVFQGRNYSIKHRRKRFALHFLSFIILWCVDIVNIKKDVCKGNIGIVGFLHENTHI